jgi:hypothetical protein
MPALLIPLVVLMMVVVLAGNRRAIRGDYVARQTRRFLSFTLAFAGLMATLYAAAGILALAVATVTRQPKRIVPGMLAPWPLIIVIPCAILIPPPD